MSKERKYPYTVLGDQQKPFDVLRDAARQQQANEPPWIEHDGSAVCPVPAGHDVEVRFANGVTRCTSHDGVFWDDTPLPDYRVTHYRDWTAWEQQQASAGEVPENPPAFPTATHHDMAVVQEGMTLRDWFAGRAMAALIAKAPAVLEVNEVTSMCQLIANGAYNYADAMLRARTVAPRAPDGDE